jgi:hypothetical protein
LSSLLFNCTAGKAAGTWSWQLTSNYLRG